MTLCRRYRVSGKVQAVFFRDSTRKIAIRIGVTGWVRNTTGGDVELVACGEQNQLSELEDWLRGGPPLAEVHDVQSETIAHETFTEFRIRY